MKLNHPRSYLVGAAAALLLVVALRAEDVAPPPPPPVSAAPAPAEPPKPAAATPAPSDTSAPAAAPAPAAEPAKEQPAATPESTELRRLDDSSAPAAAEPRHEERAKHSLHLHRTYENNGNERVSILHDTIVEKDESVQAAVAIVGDTTVDGNVSDAAVAVLGNTTVNGTVHDASVAVLGDLRVDGTVGDAGVAVGGSATVNGTVHGDLVSVGGSVKLGPDAVVDGQVVIIGGTLDKTPTSVIRGNVQRVRLPAIGGVFAWVKSALLKGRLLSFASHTGWAWVVAAAFLGLYLLLAALFPQAITKCAETLEQKPGFTILTALLTMMAMPLVFLLLAVTGVGVLVIPFLGLGMFIGKLFGRASMLAWYGRRFTGLLGGGRTYHATLAVLLGGIFVMLLYLVPVLAIAVLALNGFLGLGMVIYTLILSMRRNGTKRAPAAPPTGPAPAGLPVAAAAMAGPGEVAGAAAAPPVVAPPVAGMPPLATMSAVTLPRAGFWIRLVASALDAILVLVAAAFIHRSGLFLLFFAAYCIVLWALRGSTVGGIICGLKLVRLDDRPVDWGVAVVRGLAAFLSLAVVGLGFFWVAFDDERQSWHDKVAGTTIVKVTRGVSLV